MSKRVQRRFKQEIEYSGDELWRRFWIGLAAGALIWAAIDWRFGG